MKPDHPHDTRSSSTQANQTRIDNSFICEQVKVLCTNQRSSILISALLVAVFVVVQSDVVANSPLYAWATIISILLLARALIQFFWSFAQVTDPLSVARSRLNTLRFLSITTAVMWGSAGILLNPSDNPAHSVFTAFALAGVCAGAANTQAIDRISIWGFLLCALGPLIIYLAIKQDDTLAIGMSSMISLFLIFLLVSTRRNGLQLQEYFHLQQLAVDNESRLRQMLETSPIATRIENIETGEILFANSRYASLIDHAEPCTTHSGAGRYRIHPKDHDDVVERLNSGQPVTNQLIKLSPSHEQLPPKWVLASFSSMDYEDQPAILGWFYDITDRKIMENRVAHLAQHDALTGLPNRLLLLDRLKQAMSKANREQGVVGLLFIDLDDFKPVNDAYGHDIGDILLKAIAERITDCLRKSDSAARFGGDEFIVLLPSATAQEHVYEVAEKIRRALSLPFEIEGITLSLSASIGAATYPEHGDN
ncbi:MAG: GGDEF domain-containing protein, partial [Oceanospirillales bacterium]|nr:GGDEF domain-containing protein [Oceanospirillales bacterium]